MIRHLAYLAPLAFIGLAACDGPQALTKAKEGDCFVMAGREPGGAQKWEPCAATAGVVTAPVTGTPEEIAAAEAAAQGQAGIATAAAAPSCPTTPVTCPTTTATAAATRSTSARAERRSNNRTASRSRTRSNSRSSSSESREYARVYTEDAPPAELLGGPDDSRRFSRTERYEYSYNPPAPEYAPPSPPMESYGRKDRQAYGYSERSQGRRTPPPPPPQPLPPAQRYEGGQYGHGQSYSEGYRSGGQAYGRREEYSSTETERRSYSSSSSSSTGYSTRYGGGCCDRERSTMAPMNGPHFPVDQNGLLTWRGKTPAAPPPVAYAPPPPPGYGAPPPHK